MQINHEYMAGQLRPYLGLAEKMEDKFVLYLLEMAVEHCETAKKQPPKLPTRARKLLAAGMH